MPWLSNLPISEAQKIEGTHIMATQVPENFVLGAKLHHSRVVQHVEVPGLTRQTLLKQCLVSQTSLIFSKLGQCACGHTPFSSYCFVICPLH